jgi:alpha-N-arabinofuranosidase
MEIGHMDTEFKFLDIGDSPGAGKSQLRSDVRTALERLNFPNIRFGGNFFSGYRWIDGVGPRQERIARHDLSWNCLVPNQYGTNEFVRFCRSMNIEPYLNANCGDGDMREAADWVEYCNGNGDTALAKMRRDHGFAAPHKVKFWGIGNEVDSPHQIGYKTPQEYARAYTEFSKVMKRVDPDIKLIASGVCSWEDHPLGPQFLYQKSEWVERAQLMLEQAGDRIDYIAIHRYAHPFADDPFETYMAFAESYNEHLTAYEGLIKAVSLERGIKHAVSIAVDEWGLLRMSHGSRPRRTRNLEDALITALHLNTFIRHAYSIRLANFSSMLVSIGINLTRPDSQVLLESIFYPFELYSRTCGQLALDVFCNCDTFSGTYLGRAYNGIRILDVAATLDEARKQLVVYVVNQSENKALETHITLATGEFAGNVRVAVINGPDIKAENTEEKPNQVVTRESVMRATGKSLTFTFEPHSVTALVCPVR